MRFNDILTKIDCWARRQYSSAYNPIKHTNDSAGDRIPEEIKIRSTRARPIRECRKIDSFVYT